jgi:apolipoprotein N-acyltransferase
VRAGLNPILPLWAAIIVAAAAGPVLDAGFPDKGWWPLTFAGIALVLVALIGRRIGTAALVGFIAGLSFYLIHISWATEFLGDVVPMLALTTLESLFFALGSVAITLAYRWVPRAFPSRLSRLGMLPIVVAGLWTAREALVSVWPYGGFAWGRVALSQSEGAITPLFAWLGVSGVSFAMVWLVALAIEAVRFGEGAKLARVTLVVAVATLLLAVPAFAIVNDGSIRVGAVQGNGKAAYLDDREYGDLLQAQLDETAEMLGEEVDVVLWPEGGSDVDPTRDPDAARAFDAVSAAFEAPLVSGAITTDGTDIWNSSLLWVAGQGAIDKYDKRHPIPFGEYIPDRAFWRPFAPDLIDLVQREYTPGVTDTIFDLGDVIVGVNICFDIVDDELMRESVGDGAQVLFAQTNNADFGHTDESVQQLAIARARALELGRSVVNISTVGTSAVLLADGSTLAQLETYTAGHMVEDVPTSSTMTPAAVAGAQLTGLIVGFALAVLIIAGINGREPKVRRGRRG